MVALIGEALSKHTGTGFSLIMEFPFRHHLPVIMCGLDLSLDSQNEDDIN